MSALFRKIHRWVSVAFVAIVAGIFFALGLSGEPAAWVYYLPLAPLAVLTLTGLYMFALPYVAKSKGA